jgi:hypothetical protein
VLGISVVLELWKNLSLAAPELDSVSRIGVVVEKPERIEYKLSIGHGFIPRVG